VPAVVPCPECTHRSDLHWADPDGPDWGCHACHGPCGLGMEETGDLIAGRLDVGAVVMEEMTAAAAEGMQPGAQLNRPLTEVPGGPAMTTLSNVELAGAVMVGAMFAVTPMGRAPALLFRFFKPDRTPYPDRLLSLEPSQWDGFAELVTSAVGKLRELGLLG
jgi:hypothetical protein